MVLTAVNPRKSQGGGNKAPPPKMQAQLGLSQGNAGSTPKTSEKKRHPKTPGRGETAAGRRDNGGGGSIGTAIMEVDPVFATSIRQKLMLSPTKGRTPQIRREIIERQRKPQVICAMKVLSKGPDSLVSSAVWLLMEFTLQAWGHSYSSTKWMSPNWVRLTIYIEKQISSSN